MRASCGSGSTRPKRACRRCCARWCATTLRCRPAIWCFAARLLARTGGFAPLAVCHDWDFVLAASYASRFAFVREPLYRYRLHDANTFAGRRVAGILEGERVLAGFFARIDAHPWLDDVERAAFIRFARDAGLGGYLPGRAEAGP